MKITTFTIALFFITTLSAQLQKHQDDDGRTVKIPVVFHVVNKKAIKKMTYEKATEIINQLNENYSAKNDMSMIKPEYKELIGNPNISFYLADYNVQENGDKGIIKYKSIYVRKYKKSINKGMWLNVFVGGFGTASDMLSKNGNSIVLKLISK